MQVEEFITKSFIMKGINSDNSKSLCIFREECKGSLERNSEFEGLKERSSKFKVSFGSKISIHFLLAFTEVFLLHNLSFLLLWISQMM